MADRILLVGHCEVDGPRLQDQLSTAIPSAEIERINSDADLWQAVEQGNALMLVNREPVGFEGEGLDLIKQVMLEHPDVKAMLVSDYPDAQREAEQAGALKGFGKREMGSPGLAEHVKQALA